MKKLIFVALCTLTFNAYAECDYTQASENDGYGWDSDTQTSCPPLAEYQSADDCDYSDAAQNYGYGYNSATGESCPPVRLFNYDRELNDSKLAESKTDDFLSWGDRFEISCRAGDIATGGGCGFNPVLSALPTGWVLHGSKAIASTPGGKRDTWACSFFCYGRVGEDGTHQQNSCPSTEISVQVLCQSGN